MQDERLVTHAGEADDMLGVALDNLEAGAGGLDRHEAYLARAAAEAISAW